MNDIIIRSAKNPAIRLSCWFEGSNLTPMAVASTELIAATM